MHNSATRSLSGVIICPAFGQRLYGELHRRFTKSDTQFAHPNRHAETNSLMQHGMGFHTWFLRCSHGTRRGHNTPVHPYGKKAIPARSATIRRSAKQTEEPSETKHTLAVFTGNALQIHVATHSTMHVGDITERSRPRIKPPLATPASPGTQECDPDNIVLHTASARTMGTVTLTGRTKQVWIS
jgi:hypothetical protein